MKAHELLADISKWTRSAFARDAEGKPVDAKHPSAVQWCVDGAIQKCYGHSDYYHGTPLESAVKVRQRLFPGDDLYSMNDAGRYDDIMLILREADV